jgi:hypothetical protein
MVHMCISARSGVVVLISAYIYRKEQNQSCSTNLTDHDQGPQVPLYIGWPGNMLDSANAKTRCVYLDHIHLPPVTQSHRLVPVVYKLNILRLGTRELPNQAHQATSVG